MRKFMAKLIFVSTIALALMIGAAQFGIAGEPDMVQSSLMTGGVVTDNTHSVGIRLPRGITSLTVVCPTITSSTIAVEVSADNSTYFTHMAYNNGTNVIAAISAAGTAAKVVEFPGNFAAWRYVRVVAGTAQAADRTFTFYGTKLPH
jgi:hypothetical protein